MNIIQFKTGTSDSDGKRTGLEAGELYINTNNQSVWIGKGAGQQFQLGCFDEVVTKIDSVTGSDPTKAKFVVHTKKANGTIPAPYEITAKIDGTVDYAKKLVSSGSTGRSAGNTDKPIYFKDGIPTDISVTTGGKKLVKFDNGKITEYNTKIGEINKPVYYNPDSGFAPINALVGVNVNASRLAVADQKKKMLGTDENGIVEGYSKIGDESTPIYINPDGVPSACNLSCAGIKSSIVASGGNNYVKMQTYNNCPFDFQVKTKFSGRVEIDNITVPTGTKLDTWNGNFLISGCTYAIRCKIGNDTIILFVLDYDSSVRYSCSTSTGTKGLLKFLTLIWDKQTSKWLMNQCETPILTIPQWSDYPANQVTVLSCKQIG